MDMEEQGLQERSKQSLRLLLRLLACQTLIKKDVRLRLRSEFNITLPKFDVLAELEHAGEPITMSQLSRKLMVTNGNITGLVDRLVKEGYVSRQVDNCDRRIQRISLTETGDRLFRRMAKQHEKWITQIFGKMPMEEIVQLTELLQHARNQIRK